MRALAVVLSLVCLMGCQPQAEYSTSRVDISSQQAGIWLRSDLDPNSTAYRCGEIAEVTPLVLPDLNLPNLVSMQVQDGSLVAVFQTGKTQTTARYARSTQAQAEKAMGIRESCLQGLQQADMYRLEPRAELGLENRAVYSKHKIYLATLSEAPFLGSDRAVLLEQANPVMGWTATALVATGYNQLWKSAIEQALHVDTRPDFVKRVGNQGIDVADAVKAHHQIRKIAGVVAIFYISTGLAPAAYDLIAGLVNRINVKDAKDMLKEDEQLANLVAMEDGAYRELVRKKPEIGMYVIEAGYKVAR